ncbi:MAG: hypothetical protein Q8O95_02840 [bacterium]|nr:hypothetical protein [bacterium]
MPDDIPVVPTTPVPPATPPVPPVQLAPKPPGSGFAAKAILAIALVFFALVLGYVGAYYVVFNDLGSVFSFSSLRGDVLSQEDQALLDELGIQNGSVIGGTSSTNYSVSVLKGQVTQQEQPGTTPPQFTIDYDNCVMYVLDENGNPTSDGAGGYVSQPIFDC